MIIISSSNSIIISFFLLVFFFILRYNIKEWMHRRDFIHGVVAFHFAQQFKGLVQTASQNPSF